MTAAAPEVAPSTISAPPMGFLSRLGYGLGSMPAGILLTGLGASVLVYYLNQVVGISPNLTGNLILASLLIDAALDPLIGRWSDSVQTRWGRRHPFIYVGSVLTAVAFYALWHAPKELSASALFGYMMVLLIAVRMGNSVTDIPANALLPELAPDYDERTTLASFRWFFLMFGLVGASVMLNAYFLRTDAHHKTGLLYAVGYARFGAVFAVLLFLSAAGSALSTQKRALALHVEPQAKVPLGESLSEIVRTIAHPALIIVMLCGVFGGVGYGFRTALDNYFYTHLWGLQPQQIAGITFMSAFGALIAVIVAPVLSRRLGKKMTMITLFSVSTVVSLIPMSLKLLGLMPPNTSPWVFPILVMDAIFVLALSITGYVIISSMVADIAEDNAARTGKRSEGLLFAANGLVAKVTGGLGIFLSTRLIGFVHFPAHAVQGTVPWSTMRSLTLHFIPIYVALVAMSLIVLLFYRIDKATHERNLETMREAAAAANLPMTLEAEAGVGPL